MTDCIHGLSWNVGYVDYENTTRTIRDHLKDADKVFVIGSAKKKYMECYKINAIDIVDLGYLQARSANSYKNVGESCINHSNHQSCCAVHNVNSMKKFLVAMHDMSMDWD